MTTITKEVVLRSELESVWEAWTQADKVAKWFAPKAVIEAEAGGKYELYWDPTNEDSNSTKGCKVLKCQKPILEFEWKGPDPFAHIMNSEDDLTTVRVSLEQTAIGVKVTLDHMGFQNVDGWDEAIQWHDRAWDNVLAGLKTYVEPEINS